MPNRPVPHPMVHDTTCSICAQHERIMTLAPTYPLLIAWYSNQLQEPWNEERKAIREADPILFEETVGCLAAGKLSAQISNQYEQFKKDILAHMEALPFDPHYTDAMIECYDALQDDDLPSFRRILQDLSGNRMMTTHEHMYLLHPNEEKWYE